MEDTTQKLALSVAEAAQLLGVSRPTVYTLTRQPGFPVFKVGTRTLISADGLRRWVSERAGKAVG